jgi:hypothetical protein
MHYVEGIAEAWPVVVGERRQGGRAGRGVEELEDLVEVRTDGRGGGSGGKLQGGEAGQEVAIEGLEVEEGAMPNNVASGKSGGVKKGKKSGDGL